MTQLRGVAESGRVAVIRVKSVPVAYLVISDQACVSSQCLSEHATMYLVQPLEKDSHPPAQIEQVRQGFRLIPHAARQVRMATMRSQAQSSSNF